MIIELCILWSDVFLNISSILFLSHHQFTKVMILNNTLFLSGADICELYVCIFWNVFIQKISPISVCMEVRVIYWVFLIIPLLLIISSISIWETVFLNWSRSLLFYQCWPELRSSCLYNIDLPSEPSPRSILAITILNGMKYYVTLVYYSLVIHLSEYFSIYFSICFPCAHLL